MWQDLAVVPIVAAALAWVVWTLLLPRAAADRLRRLAGRSGPSRPSGCGGCCGCSDEGSHRKPHSTQCR